MADEPHLPSEEELREALGRVGVSDILVNALSAAASIGFHRLSSEARDLGQVRLAIESLRALDPVLRDGGVDEAIVRDLEQARANLQLAYAAAVAEPGRREARAEERVSTRLDPERGDAMGIDDILGQVLERAGSGARTGGTGGLSDLLNQLDGGAPGGRAQGGAAGMGGMVAMLAPLIARFLRDGGLEKLLRRFQDAGKGEQARSWVATGENKPVTADDVDEVLSAEEIDEVARELGVSREQAAGVLAEVLPGVVDAVTPSGEVPSAEELAARLGY